jgi:hypothetical protein
MKKLHSLKFLTVFIFFLGTSACNEYWWTRGQAPSPAESLKKAQDRISENKLEFKDMRPEITKTAEKIVAETTKLSEDNLDAIFADLENSFLSLEGKLSYGNRPPYNELLGQLRVLREKTKSKDLKIEAAQLYLSRVLFFLSTEMKVPAPDPVRIS